MTEKHRDLADAHVKEWRMRTTIYEMMRKYISEAKPFFPER